MNTPGPVDASSKLFLQAVIVLVKVGLWPALLAFTTVILASSPYLRSVATQDRERHRYEAMPLGLFDYGLQVHRWAVSAPPPKSEAPPEQPQPTGMASSMVMDPTSDLFADFSIESAFDRLNAYASVFIPRLVVVALLAPAIAGLLACGWLIGRGRCATLTRAGGAQKPHWFVWSLNLVEICCAAIIAFAFVPLYLPFTILAIPVAAAWYGMVVAGTNKF
jgi:hypothetical protein